MSEKEKFEFEEVELKALIFMMADYMGLFIQFDAKNYKNEKSARLAIEESIMRHIDECLDRKRAKT